MEERKAYIVTLDRDPELTYVMGLTRDQVSVFKWLRENGYDIDINEQGDVISYDVCFAQKKRNE